MNGSLHCVLKFHELWSTNAEKWERHIYPTSVNVLCCFFASLRRQVTQQNSTKLCDVLGSKPDLQTHARNCRGSLPKIGELKTLILGRFSTRQNYARWRKIWNRSFYPLSVNACYDYGSSGIRWRRLANISETINLVARVDPGAPGILSWQWHRVERTVVKPKYR